MHSEKSTDLNLLFCLFVTSEVLKCLVLSLLRYILCNCFDVVLTVNLFVYINNLIIYVMERFSKRLSHER